VRAELVRNQQERPWDALPAEAYPALVPHLPSVAEAIVEAIATQIPDYARPLEGRFGGTVRGGVQQALAQFVSMATRPGTGRGTGRDVYVALGQLEAREGRSLESLLAAYRVGARVAWRRLATIGLEAGLSSETLVLLAESIFAYIDELSAESAEGYAREQAARAGELDRRRRALLAALVADPPPEHAVLAAAAETARWPLPRDLAIVAWPAAAGAAPASRLPVGSVAAPVDGLVCAAIPDPLGPGRRAEAERALEGVPAGLGPPVDPAGGARSFRHAAGALRLAEARGTAALLAAEEHRTALLWRAEPHLVSDLADERLAPLDPETPASRDRLSATLLAWLRHDAGVVAAAAELGVHAQTVRYRLGRLRERFGAALDDPDARFELELALRARRELA
jgi:PucR C-terminal helix-turn-helix domain